MFPNLIECDRILPFKCIRMFFQEQKKYAQQKRGNPKQSNLPKTCPDCRKKMQRKREKNKKKGKAKC